MTEVVFSVTTCDETGGYVACWNDPSGGGISTQGDSLAELAEMVKDAASGYFADLPKLPKLKLHFVEDPVLAVA